MKVKWKNFKEGCVCVCRGVPSKTPGNRFRNRGWGAYLVGVSDTRAVVVKVGMSRAPKQSLRGFFGATNTLP